MEKEKNLTPTNLELNRLKAQNRISAYLETPGEKKLRSHQIDVFESLSRHFGLGKNSGTIVLPTGAGKTHIASELIRVLDLPAIVFSPTKEVLHQNKKVIKSTSPSKSVSNFYGEERDLSGDILNTLYQSFPALSKNEAHLKKIGLVIYDEADLSLGEERHKIHSQFPDAIKIALTATPYYQQLEGYKKRGLIDLKAEWVKTFTDVIHDMSVEEALERGIIPPLDIHLVKTDNVVPNIPLNIGGDYDPSQLARYLNVRSRNALAIAMIAGLNKIPSGINISGKTKEELIKIHQKIKGKRTVIHGMNIAHIKGLEDELNKAGINAKAIDGSMKSADRQMVISEVKNGGIQVLLGDQLTARGLDIPELEAGIYMSPTTSNRQLAQQVGRLFRHSPDTGKETGLAIQLIDTHTTSSARQPILIPSLYDPGFVLRGTTTGLEHTPSEKAYSKPVFSIQGTIDLKTYLEEIKLQDVFQNRFRYASLDEISKIISDIYHKTISESDRDTSLFNLYKTFTNKLPARTSFEASQRAMDAMASRDPREAKKGTEVFIALNLKSILKAVKPFLTENTDTDNDLIQHVITEVTSLSKELINVYTVSALVSHYSKYHARSFLAQQNDVPTNWIRNNIHQEIIGRVDYFLNINTAGINNAAIEEFTQEVSVKFKVDSNKVKKLILTRYIRHLDDTPVKNTQDETTMISRISLKKVRSETYKLLDTLTPKQKYVLEKRIFDEELLEEVGKSLDVTRERARQIEAKAIRTLRHPARRENLPYLKEFIYSKE